MLTRFVHAIFLMGVVGLFVMSSQSSMPIHVRDFDIILIFSVFLFGYSIVFFRWILLVKSSRFYDGGADNVPEYLSQQLWGAYPYLGSFGKKKFANVGLFGRSTSNNITNIYRKYSDLDVRGKLFREVFVLHVNKEVTLLYTGLSVAAAYMAINQVSPSFLNFLFYYPLLYVIYISFLMVMSLSSIAIVLFRAIAVFYSGKN